MKNIRRCLKPQKADKASLAASLVAAATAFFTGVLAAWSKGAVAWWALIPVCLAIGTGVVAVLRYLKALEPDDHLQAAQEDADRLIALQARAQAEIDRKLVAQLAQAASAHQAPPAGGAQVITQGGDR